MTLPLLLLAACTQPSAAPAHVPPPPAAVPAPKLVPLAQRVIHAAPTPPCSDDPPWNGDYEAALQAHQGFLAEAPDERARAGVRSKLLYILWRAQVDGAVPALQSAWSETPHPDPAVGALVERADTYALVNPPPAVRVGSGCYAHGFELVVAEQPVGVGTEAWLQTVLRETAQQVRSMDSMGGTSLIARSRAEWDRLLPLFAGELSPWLTPPQTPNPETDPGWYDRSRDGNLAVLVSVYVERHFSQK